MKEAREKRKMTRKELAQAVGCSYQTIAKIELGERTPSLNMAKRIAKCLGKTVDAIFFANHTDKKYST